MKSQKFKTYARGLILIIVDWSQCLIPLKQERVPENLEPSLLLAFILRAREDLNPRPTEPESVALSTEPRALIVEY